MVLELDRAPASLLSPADSMLPAGATLRRVTDPTGIGDVAGIMSRVWNEDFSWMHDRFGEHLAIPGYLSLYVIDVDGRPASAGWTYFTEGHFAGLWGGSTVAEHRGRGLYTALLAVRVQEARARGYRYLTIDAGDMSRPIVERHGFRLLAHATACEWNPPG
jgi:GNAT superfamily N-acetyltransferase